MCYQIERVMVEERFLRQREMVYGENQLLQVQGLISRQVSSDITATAITTKLYPNDCKAILF